MWTGRQTLGEIEGALSKLRREEGQLDGAWLLPGARRNGCAPKRNALRELARIKLDEMTAGRLVRNLDAAERRALQIFENHRLQIGALNSQRQIAIAEVERAEGERHSAAGPSRKHWMRSTRSACVPRPASRNSEPGLTQQVLRAAADAIAGEAEKKAALSEEELGAKKKLYDNDPLFAYLWRAISARRLRSRQYRPHDRPSGRRFHRLPRSPR